jgi:transposase-like protein
MSEIKDNYNQYVNSNSWENTKILNEEIYLKMKWPIICVRCGTNSTPLHSHHNFYPTDLNNVNISDIDYLCPNCHKQWHLIQKSTGRSQNWWVLLNFCFYNQGKEYVHKERISGLLSSKIDTDERNIGSYFVTSNVVKYETEEAKMNRRALPFLIISFFLIFYYGIGLVTWWLTVKSTKNMVSKPFDYDSFVARRKQLKSKRDILRALNEGFDKEDKYNNYLLNFK